MGYAVAILGAGFIGRNYISRALESGEIVRVLDHKDCPREFEGRLTWIKGDLSDERAVHRVLRDVEVVFHFISSTVPGDVADESWELTQNVIQTLQLLKLCVQEKVRRIVFISSASVYGIQVALPIVETAPTDPISSHGIHKLTIEKYLQLYNHQHVLDCKIMRLSNPYGPGQNITGRQGFIAIVIGKILTGDPIKIRGDGSIVRDYVYIDDVTDALWLMGNCSAKESVFNVGSGKGYTLSEVVKSMSRLIGTPIKIEYTDSRFVDIPASILDISRGARILSMAPATSLEIGLAKTLAFHGLSVNT
jgi:UDP-glucose 4-epimerase